MPDPFGIRRGAGVPVRRQIAAELEEGILAGRLAAGRRLPSLRALADRLGVHRNTVAAAYRELERSGLVRRRPGSGVYVSSLAPPEDRPTALLFRLMRERRGRQRVRSFLEDLAAWVEALEGGRIAVVEEEPQLLALLTWEVRRLFPTAHVRGVLLSRARDVPGSLATWVPMARPIHLEVVRRLLPPGRECLPLRAHLPEVVEARIGGLRVPATIAAISGSPLVLRWLRERAWRARGEALGFLALSLAEVGALARARQLAELVLADALTFRRLPPSLVRRGVEVRLLAAGSVAELQALVSGVWRGRASHAQRRCRCRNRRFALACCGEDTPER